MIEETRLFMTGADVLNSYTDDRLPYVTQRDETNQGETPNQAMFC